LELVLKKISLFSLRTGHGLVRREKKGFSFSGCQKKSFYYLFPGKLELGTAGSFFFCEHEKKHKQTPCVCSKMQTHPIVSTRKKLILKDKKLRCVERISPVSRLGLRNPRKKEGHCYS